MNFQELILSLQKFWSDHGCLISQPYDIETGAGTMNPHTFLRVLGENSWNVAYVEPSRRPTDGRYGENPFRVYKHYQFQVIMKPSPDNIQDLYIESLKAFGIKPEEHDIRFEEDNWESPTLGAWGVGWQVLLDGMEITQFTYLQQAGGIDLKPVSVEITYGIERICMFINGIDNMYNLEWGHGVSYGEIRKRDEYEFSRYSFELADIDLHFKLFDLYEAECLRVLAQKLPIAAFDSALKCSHAFNVLDARNALSVTERARFINRVRTLACACAESHLEVSNG
ncbi:MAG: glycine--tRNA ligase subunit alpha [Acidobacteria bacterium CG_4_9_14_3_um_filter_49_7]|nr:MAG: glycine--tRNA ligase subunit alpha [Acidobacteria bacterium CG_4_9_14_3_um_filter_49_7]